MFDIADKTNSLIRRNEPCCEENYESIKRFSGQCGLIKRTIYMHTVYKKIKTNVECSLFAMLT